MAPVWKTVWRLGMVSKSFLHPPQCQWEQAGGSVLSQVAYPSPLMDVSTGIMCVSIASGKLFKEGPSYYVNDIVAL